MTEESYAVLIRHGAYHQRPGAPSARQPFALSENGMAQARDCATLVAQLLLQQGLSLSPVLYCSHQLRAWQTAQVLVKGLGALGQKTPEIRETGALAERGLGSAANLTVDEIEAVLRDDPRYDLPPEGWKSDSDYRLPLEGAESLTEAGQRVAAHLQSTTPAHPGKVTLHVGHGASFRHACSHLGVMNRHAIAGFSMFHATPLLFCYDRHGSWHHLAGDWKIRPPKDEPID